MKNTIKTFLVLVISGLLLTSCEEERTFFDPDNQSFTSIVNFSDPNPDFSIQIGETREFQLEINSAVLSNNPRTVTFTLNEEESTLDPTFYTVSSFDVVIPANEFTGLTTITVEDVLGDVADPETIIFDINESDTYNLGLAPRATVSVGIDCPFVYEDIPEGTYEVTLSSFGDFFEDTTTTRTVELGPGDNQVTIVEGEYPIEGSDPLIITLDDTGRVIAVNEDGFAFGNGPVSIANGFPPNFYLLGSDEGAVLSCIGRFTLVLNFSPFNGNVHSFNLRFIQ